MILQRLILLSCLGFILGTGTYSLAQVQTVSLSPEENSFYQMVNQFRKKLNLPILEIHVALQKAARAHSAWMAKQDFLTHFGPTDNMKPFERMIQQGYANYTFAGENIQCGHSDAITTFRQWAMSPLHLKTMINPHYHQLGISREGTGHEECPYYWTSDYGSFADGNLDPAAVTDITRIEQAVIAVSGGKPLAHSLVLATPTPTPAEDEDAPPAAPAAPTRGTVKVFQCLVPSRLGLGILSDSAGVDTLVEADRDRNGAVTLSLGYFENSQNTSDTTVQTQGVSLLANPDFPLVTLFVAPTQQYGGFTIQMNTKTNQAQYTSYDLSPAKSGTLLCTIKYY